MRTTKKWIASTALGAVLCSIALSAGCTDSKNVTGQHKGYGRFPTEATQTATYTAPPPADTTSTYVAPPPVVATGNCANYRPAAGANMVVTGLAFPTGDPATSAVLLHQVMPDEARLGRPFAVEYHVTNITAGDLENVIVLLENASNLRIDSSEPRGIPQAGGMAWSVGTLASCETKVIKGMARADQLGAATNCLSVSYSSVLCAGTQVVNPAIRLTKSATPTASVCDNINFEIAVTNTGTGLAEQVVISDKLPAGLMTLDGQSEVTINVGNLAEGETKTYNMTAKAERPGRYTNQATASAFEGLTASSERTTTVVTAPVLAIAPTCEEFEYIGRNIDSSFTVRNTGDGVCENTTVTATLPAGTQFVSAGEGGTSAGGNVSWNLGALNPGESRTVSFVMSPGPEVSSVTTTATASCTCAESVSASCTTEVRGIPAILLEVVDIMDPVEVGDETTYVITVTNQGSADDNDIRVIVTLPPELGYVSDSGATDGIPNGQRIVFNPLPTLAPKAKAEWRLQVKSLRAGDVRGRFEMTSKQFQNPVIETESTNLYD